MSERNPHELHEMVLGVRWPDRSWPDDPWDDPSHLADPNVGNPDAEAGTDYPDQRPITDNKAGG